MFRSGREGKRSTDLLMRCIAEVEVRTSAEIVLAVRSCSGSYADLNWLVGFACSYFLLNLVLFVPQEFHPSWIPLPLLCVFMGGAALSDRIGIGVRLAGPSRRKKQVDQDARALFFDHVAGRTRGQSGILISISIREQLARIELENGAASALPRDMLSEIEKRLQEDLLLARSQSLAERLGGTLRSLGVALERYMPLEENLEFRNNQLPDTILIDSRSESEL